MDPITLLLRKAQKYLRSAAVLLEMEDYDSTVSRAYFAMFYAAQALVKRRGLRLAPGQTLREAFVTHFVANGPLPERAAQALEEGYQLMELGDFAHTFGVSGPQAEAMLAEAEAFVNSVSTLAETP